LSTDRTLSHLRASAAAWHDRLSRDDATEWDRREFDRWQAESFEHRRAYAEIQQVWNLLGAIPHEPEILVLRHETALRLTRSAMTHVRPLRLAIAATLLLVLGGVVALIGAQPVATRSLLGRILSPGSNRTYSTNVGELLSVTLIEGTRVTLDTQSQLAVAFSKRERDVHLIRGQALFEVAKDSARPFVVTAGTRRFVAVGTAFNVRVSTDQIQVTMIEGTVRVEPDAGAGTSAPATKAAHRDGMGTSDASDSELHSALNRIATIKMGDQLVIDAHQADQVHSVDAGQVITWQRGELVFDDTSLADAVGELNRYSASTITIADPQLGRLRISGTFASNRPDLFVEAITDYFHIDAARTSSGTILSERGQKDLR
jgi:transmembrane sensor